MTDFYKKNKKILLTVLSAILFVGLWWLCSLAYGKPLLLPAPPAVFAAFSELLATRAFWGALLGSVGRILLGTLLGIAVGLLAGVLCYASQALSYLISPLFSIIRATPVACFIILAWVFIGSDALPVFISALMVAPVMLTGTVTGLESTDAGLLEAAGAYRLTFIQRVRCCYLPALSPHFRGAAINCTGLAWKAGIAAEIIVKTEDSLGEGIWNAKSWEVNYDELFAWTVAVIAVSLGFEWLLRFLLKERRGA